MKTSLVLVLFSVLAGLWVAEAQLSRGTVKVAIEYGRKLWYCEYKGLEVLPRTRIIDREGCMRCTCSRSGLRCASMVPTFNFPDDSDCMPISVRCSRVVWVQRTNPRRTCPEFLMPKDISAVLK